MGRIILGAISLCLSLVDLGFGYFISGGINILTGQSYPNINGLLDCVVMGFPFFKKTLLSTIVFSLLFFTLIRPYDTLLVILNKNGVHLINK